MLPFKFNHTIRVLVYREIMILTRHDYLINQSHISRTKREDHILSDTLSLKIRSVHSRLYCYSHLLPPLSSSSSSTSKSLHPSMAAKKPGVIALFDVDGTLTAPRKEATPELLEFIRELRKVCRVVDPS